MPDTAFNSGHCTSPLAISEYFRLTLSSLALSLSLSLVKAINYHSTVDEVPTVILSYASSFLQLCTVGCTVSFSCTSSASTFHFSPLRLILFSFICSSGGSASFHHLQQHFFTCTALFVLSQPWPVLGLHSSQVEKGVFAPLKHIPKSQVNSNRVAFLP